jgi:hypothetical protein
MEFCDCSLTEPVRVDRPEHFSASGNPVRIGDGCATVSGYKLLYATAPKRGKAGARLEAPSQDTGWKVLIAAPPT